MKRSSAQDRSPRPPRAGGGCARELQLCPKNKEEEEEEEELFISRRRVSTACIAYVYMTYTARARFGRYICMAYYKVPRVERENKS